MFNSYIYLLNNNYEQYKAPDIMTTMEFNNRLINMEERLERFALSLTANREAAKDLVQETYLKAL